MQRDEAIKSLGTLRRSFAARRTRPVEWRLDQLDRLKAMLTEREEEFLRALRADLGKAAAESWLSEIGFILREIDHVRRHLRRWLKPNRVTTPLICQPGRSVIAPEPYGVVLIIAPWNYPVHLAFLPLVGAIAAGNCALVKPSEIAANSSAAIARLVPIYLDSACIAVVEGGPAETAVLLEERFDSIFFSGNSRVGRLVMAAAARHLTPVTLELGGKNPCIVDQKVDLSVAARRIAWGKFLNAGQTCVAPDYVLVHEARHDELLARIADCIGKFYGSDPGKSPDYARIINARHLERLRGLLAEGEIHIGGEWREEDLYVAPTVLKNISPEAAVMQEEIFGPILPVLPYDDTDEALGFVNRRRRPLAVYVFSQDPEVQRRMVEETISGAVCVNDVAMNLSVQGLPFGGVGDSGMGAYHGPHSFDLFTHPKAVLTRSTRFDFDIRYPPFNDRKLKWLRRLF